MHAEFFLDTNILLYAASSAKSEQRKRATARELLAMEGGGFSVQVQAEFYVNATTEFKLPHVQVVGILESLEACSGRPSRSKTAIGTPRSSRPPSNLDARPSIRKT